jgi:Icc-related predicted phosphoesterase
MRVLAFSDLHRDRDRARGVVEKAAKADVVIGAGDFCMWHIGLGRTIEVLRAIERPTVLVPGNHERAEALRRAVADWPAATVLHGEALEIGGMQFFGLGAAVPPAPLPWSFDLDEDAARQRLSACPADGVLVVHAPPHGHVDVAFGRHLGSRAVLETVHERRPRLVVCGHIHQCWGRESRIGPTRVLNAGPYGTLLEI